MKQIIITSVAVATLILGGALALNHYHPYKNKQAHQAVVTAQKKQDELTKVKQSAAAEYASLNAQYIKTQAECQKGRLAYDSLTSAIKAKIPAPDCSGVVR
ncbi:MAG: hypothetical protein NVS1B10_08620 [Candidatus Saccharimonadales bacterium]